MPIVAWQVTKAEGASVFCKQSASSVILGSRPLGSPVVGRRRGDWVEFSNRPGYLQLADLERLTVAGRPLLARLTSKPCNGTEDLFPIFDVATCMAAGEALGLWMDMSLEVPLGAEGCLPPAAISQDGKRQRVCSNSQLLALHIGEHAPRIKLLTVNTFAEAAYEMPGVPGMDFQNLGAGVKWRGFYTKVDRFLPVLREQVECNPEQILIFADGTDIIYGGCGEDLMLRRYQMLVEASGGAKIVCGADTEVYPTNIGPPSRFDFLDSRRTAINQAFGLPTEPFKKYYKWDGHFYKFVNSGFMMGPAAAMLDVFQCMQIYGNSTGKYDDQDALSECMLLNPATITIDYTGQLVQTVKNLHKKVVYGVAGRIHSAVTKAPACFAHFNEDPWPSNYIDKILKADPSKRCDFLVAASVPDMVRTGFGARVDELYFALLRSVQNGCSVIVSRSVAMQWTDLSLGTFWHTEVADEEFAADWEAAQPCPNLRLKFVPDFMRCENVPEMGWFVPMLCNDITRLNGSDPLLSIFSPRLAAYKKPYGDLPYTGLHVREGDKASESKVFSLDVSMQQERELWPDHQNMFIASADPGLTASPTALTLIASGFRFKSSASVVQADSAFNHASDDGAVSGVFDDIFGLAHADIVMGNYASNFFMLAQALNQRLHGPDRQNTNDRPVPWCFDLLSNGACDDGKALGDIACQTTKECWCDRPVVP